MSEAPPIDPAAIKAPEIQPAPAAAPPAPEKHGLSGLLSKLMGTNKPLTESSPKLQEALSAPTNAAEIGAKNQEYHEANKDTNVLGRDNNPIDPLGTRIADRASDALHSRATKVGAAAVIAGGTIAGAAGVAFGETIPQGGEVSSGHNLTVDMPRTNLPSLGGASSEGSSGGGQEANGSLGTASTTETTEAGGAGGSFSDNPTGGLREIPEPQIVSPAATTGSEGGSGTSTTTAPSEAGGAAAGGSTEKAEVKTEGTEVNAPELKAPEVTKTKENGEWRTTSSETTVTLADGSKAKYDATTGGLTDAAGNAVENADAASLAKLLAGSDADTQAKLTSGDIVAIKINGDIKLVDKSGNDITTGAAVSADEAVMKAIEGQIASGEGVKVDSTATQESTWKEKVSVAKEFDVKNLTAEQAAEIFAQTVETDDLLKPIMPKVDDDGRLIVGGSNATHGRPTTPGPNKVSGAIVGHAVNKDGGVEYGAVGVMRIAGIGDRHLETLALRLNNGSMKVDDDGNMRVDDPWNEPQTGFSGSGTQFFNDARVVHGGNGDAFIVFNFPDEEGMCQFDGGGEGFVVGPNQAVGSSDSSGPGAAFNWGAADGAFTGACGMGSITGESGTDTRTNASSARLIVAPGLVPPVSEERPPTPGLPATGSSVTIPAAVAGSALTAAGIGLVAANRGRAGEGLALDTGNGTIAAGGPPDRDVPASLDAALREHGITSSPPENPANEAKSSAESEAGEPNIDAQIAQLEEQMAQIQNQINSMRGMFKGVRESMKRAKLAGIETQLNAKKSFRDSDLASETPAEPDALKPTV